MFEYNRFWHYWFQLNNLHYFRASLASLVISLLLIPAAVFFPPLWGLVVAPPLIVGGTIALFTQLSNFFYNRQNHRLTQLKAETLDEALKEDIDLYLNRRVVCPQELLAGTHLNLPHDTLKMKVAVASKLLVFETEDTLNIPEASNDMYHRNSAVKATSESNQLKTVIAKDGSSEVAAREMAEILGFGGLIPSNTIAGTDVLDAHKDDPFIPNAVDGEQVCRQLFNEPFLREHFVFSHLTGLQKREQRAQAKKIVQKISLPSFQENFLLHLILGSQDAKPGNTLFTKGPNDVMVLHSIDHERIMPEDNYNITKRIPLGNGENSASVEKDIKNVFPIHLWLAGLPQADVPFTKEIIEKALESLNPQRLLAYHRQKKLFSPAAVGAQLDRILLIKNAFEAEIKKSKITLTPKELFLKLINNHPTYMFLKNEFQLSDFHIFELLGKFPEGADMSLLRHPLQWFPMVGMVIEVHQNNRQGRPPYSEESFNSSHAHHLQFFAIAEISKVRGKANKAGLDILAETYNQLSLTRSV